MKWSLQGDRLTLIIVTICHRVTVFLLMMRTLKIHSLSNFRIYNTMLLITLPKPICSPRTSYLETGGFTFLFQILNSVQAFLGPLPWMHTPRDHEDWGAGPGSRSWEDSGGSRECVCMSSCLGPLLAQDCGPVAGSSVPVSTSEMKEKDFSETA